MGCGLMTRKTALPKYCSAFNDRHGKTRIKFRKGRFSAYVTSSPVMGDDFQAEYHGLVSGDDPRVKRPIGADRTTPGTINALIVSFYSSPRWTGYRAETQRTYLNIIERFREKHGDKRVAMLQRRHVQAIIDKQAATPAAANRLLSVIRILMAHTILQGMREDNPCREVEKIRYKTDGYHSWTDKEIKDFEAAYPVGSRERLAFALLLYTGQRWGDVIGMGPQHVRGDMISVTQSKTGHRLEIPMHRDLARAIRETATGDLAFLITRDEKPFTASGFGNWWRKVLRAADLPKRCVPHGLRKAA